MAIIFDTFSQRRAGAAVVYHVFGAIADDLPNGRELLLVTSVTSITNSLVISYSGAA